jgi:hypothetical protein
MRVRRLPGTVPFLVLALAVAACGASARDQAIHATLVSVNAARDGFSEWDRRKQQSIVEAATSLDDGKAKLVDYRRKREPVVDGFVATYRAIAIAAVVSDDPTSLATLLEVARRLSEALVGLGCDFCKLEIK